MFLLLFLTWYQSLIEISWKSCLIGNPLSSMDPSTCYTFLTISFISHFWWLFGDHRHRVFDDLFDQWYHHWTCRSLICPYLTTSFLDDIWCALTGIIFDAPNLVKQHFPPVHGKASTIVFYHDFQHGDRSLSTMPPLKFDVNWSIFFYEGYFFCPLFFIIFL